MILEPGVRVLVAVTLMPRASHPLLSPQLLLKVQVFCSHGAITKGKILLSRIEYFVNAIIC